MDATAPISDIPAELSRRGQRTLRILNKIDAEGARREAPSDHAISARTGAGISELVAKLRHIVRDAAEGASSAPAITQR